MPFRSKAQQRWMFAAEARGELPKGTAMEWAHETKKQPGGFKKLPEKVKKPKGFKAKPMKKASEQHIGVTAPDLLPQDTKLTGLEALFPALALGAGGALYGAIQSPGDSPMRGAMIGGAGGVGAGLGFTGGHHFIKSKYGEPMASNAMAAGTILGGAALGGHMGLHTGRALAEMTGVGDPKDKVDNDLEELDVMNGRSHLPGYMGDFVRRKQAFAKVAEMFSTTGGGMASPQIAPQPALGLYTDNEPSLPSYAHAVPMGEATPGFKPFQAQPSMMMQGGGFDLNPGFAGQDVTDDQTDDGAGIKLAGYLLQAGRPKHKVSQPSKVTVSKGKSTIQNGSVHPRKAKEPDGKVRRFEADLLKAEAMSCKLKSNCKKAAAPTGLEALFDFGQVKQSGLWNFLDPKPQPPDNLANSAAMRTYQGTMDQVDTGRKLRQQAFGQIPSLTAGGAASGVGQPDAGMAHTPFRQDAQAIAQERHLMREPMLKGKSLDSLLPKAPGSDRALRGSDAVPAPDYAMPALSGTAPNPDHRPQFVPAFLGHASHDSSGVVPSTSVGAFDLNEPSIVPSPGSQDPVPIPPADMLKTEPSAPAKPLTSSPAVNSMVAAAKPAGNWLYDNALPLGAGAALAAGLYGMSGGGSSSGGGQQAEEEEGAPGQRRRGGGGDGGGLGAMFPHLLAGAGGAAGGAYLANQLGKSATGPDLQYKTGGFSDSLRQGVHMLGTGLASGDPLYTAGTGAVLGGGLGALNELRRDPEERNYGRGMLGGAVAGGALGGGAGLLMQHGNQVAAAGTTTPPADSPVNLGAPEALGSAAGESFEPKVEADMPASEVAPVPTAAPAAPVGHIESAPPEPHGLRTGATSAGLVGSGMMGLSEAGRLQSRVSDYRKFRGQPAAPAAGAAAKSMFNAKFGPGRFRAGRTLVPIAAGVALDALGNYLYPK